MVGEALSRMILVADEANMITGFRLAINSPMVTHLQFADYTLISCAAEEEQIKNVVATLGCFEAVSGLKVNFCKSSIIGIVVDAQFLEVLATMLGCNVGLFQLHILGCPSPLGGLPSKFGIQWRKG